LSKKPLIKGEGLSPEFFAKMEEKYIQNARHLNHIQAARGAFAVPPFGFKHSDPSGVKTFFAFHICCFSSKTRRA
jgi:hypothetical protein